MKKKEKEKDGGNVRVCGEIKGQYRTRVWEMEEEEKGEKHLMRCKLM